MKRTTQEEGNKMDTGGIQRNKQVEPYVSSAETADLPKSIGIKRINAHPLHDTMREEEEGVTEEAYWSKQAPGRTLAKPGANNNKTERHQLVARHLFCYHLATAAARCHNGKIWICKI